MNTAGIIDLVPPAVRQQWKDEGIYPNKSAFELFREQVKAHPDQAAVISPDGHISYRELYQAALRLARGFRDAGVVPGDVIACQLPNHWACCAIDLAGAALGAVVAPFPAGRDRLDIQSLIRRCNARVIVAPEVYNEVDVCAMIESLRPSLLSLRLLVVQGTPREGWQTLDRLLAAEPLSEAELPSVCPDSPVRLLVSSGTESEPKLVAYSHNALVGGRGRFLQRLLPENETFTGFYMVPLGSAFGSTATVGVLCWLGGTVVIMPKFSVSQAVQIIERSRPNFLLGVPTMMQRIAAEPALQQIDRSGLRALICGGAVIDRATVQRCTGAFGCSFINLYGSADGVNCHTLPDDDIEAILTTAGKPNPGVCEIRIADDEGQELPQGEIGEVLARGPLSPMQYVNAPDLDARYRTSEGWVKTGDLGMIDAKGYLVLKGRKKDIIIRGGVNISPVQVEGLVAEHPDVVSVACVPVPDEDMGQRLCLCVTLKEGSTRFSLPTIRGFLQQAGLDAGKLPEYLHFRRQLPMTPAGKVDKRTLAQDVAALAVPTLKAG